MKFKEIFHFFVLVLGLLECKYLFQFAYKLTGSLSAHDFGIILLCVAITFGIVFFSRFVTFSGKIIKKIIVCGKV